MLNYCYCKDNICTIHAVLRKVESGFRFCYFKTREGLGLRPRFNEVKGKPRGWLLLCGRVSTGLFDAKSITNVNWILTCKEVECESIFIGIDLELRASGGKEV